MVPPRDADALAQAIARLLDDRAFAMRIGRQARAKAEHEFGLSRMLDRMQAVFETAISQAHG
jgi:glycosyltransferase involved in cell wall biosynthesis